MKILNQEYQSIGDSIDLWIGKNRYYTNTEGSTLFFAYDDITVEVQKSVDVKDLRDTLSESRADATNNRNIFIDFDPKNKKIYLIPQSPLPFGAETTALHKSTIHFPRKTASTRFKSKIKEPSALSVLK